MLEPNSKKRRKIINFAIAPRKQLRLALLAVGVGVVSMIGFFTFSLWVNTQIIHGLELSPDIRGSIENSVLWSWIGFGLFTFVFIITTIIAIFVISHRIYGPMVAIKRHLEQLIQRNFTHRTKLRPGDDFVEIAELLNKLSEILDEKD